ncbi:hypothetical protein [Moorena producens]|uniref:hypothetical protein n=1 Tax=Moorena producens TaxID=1155739 RepID=UPI003C711C04
MPIKSTLRFVIARKHCPPYDSFYLFPVGGQCRLKLSQAWQFLGSTAHPTIHFINLINLLLVGSAD